MREFVFDIVYEGEPAPVRRLTSGDGQLSSVGVGGCIDDDEFWRIERFTGPETALDALDESTLQRLLDVEGITPDDCEGQVHTEILEHSAEQLEVYYHVRNLAGCESVTTLAVEYLGTDVLFELERADGAETWTVMMESDDGVGLLYDALQATLRSPLRFAFDHIGQASDRRVELFASKNLPAEQREALVAAVQHGYYETPRQTTLDELADRLDCPRSTLSYRLRRAESKLAKSFAVERGSEELRGLPRTEET